MSERTLPIKKIAAVAGVFTLAAGLFAVGRFTADTSPLPDPSSTRFILVVEEDDTGRLTVGSYDSDSARADAPDNPRRFLDPIPTNCAEATAGINQVVAAFEDVNALTDDDRPFFDRHVLIAQHTCSFEEYVRFLAAGFDEWLYPASGPTTPAAEEATAPEPGTDLTTNGAAGAPAPQPGTGDQTGVPAVDAPATPSVDEAQVPQAER